MRPVMFEVRRNVNGLGYVFHVKGQNKKTLFVSKTFKTREGVINTIRSFLTAIIENEFDIIDVDVDGTVRQIVSDQEFIKGLKGIRPPSPQTEPIEDFGKITPLNLKFDPKRRYT